MRTRAGNMTAAAKNASISKRNKIPSVASLATFSGKRTLSFHFSLTRMQSLARADRTLNSAEGETDVGAALRGEGARSDLQ